MHVKWKGTQNTHRKQLEIFVVKQNLCVENMTLPNLWQQAEIEHDKARRTLFQALPAVGKGRHLLVPLQMCVLHIKCMCGYASFYFPILVSSPFVIYFSSYRENRHFAVMLQSTFKTTVN